MKKITRFLVFLCLVAGHTVSHADSPGNDLNNPLADDGWTVVDMYTVNAYAGGLAFDGQYFYIGSYGGGFGDRMYRFDPETEELILLFQGTGIQSSYGLTYDGSHLWTIQQMGASVPAKAVKIDMDGNQLQEFSLPGNYMSGIAWDQGNFWVATYFPNPGTIHYVDNEGNQLSSFVPPSNQPWDLALQDDDLWIVDFWNNFIHLVEADGTMVASFPYSDHRATGIYHDGTFLWYIGRTSLGVSTLYKVDPFGSGTPVIQVTPSYFFGNVTVGDSEQWAMNIQNTGTGELTIHDISFLHDDGAFSIDASFPFSIEPGAAHSIDVFFSPETIASFDDVLLIHSNDPATPVASVDLSGYGLADGPFLHTGQDLIDYGNVRINSTSRLYLELTNMGNEVLVIDDIELSPLDYYFDRSVEFPISVAPVADIELPLWFRPASAGTVPGTATLYFNNDEQSPYVIELTGFSEDTDHPVGTVLWEIQLPGSSFDNPRAIMSIPDVTDDGIDDVIVCTRGNRIMLFNGNSSGTPDLIWETSIGTVEYPKAIAVADDLNGDGSADFVIGTAYGDRAVTAVSPRTGDIIWRFETNVWGGGGWVYMIDVRYDYTGNGYRDVLAAAGDDGQGFGPRRVFLLNGLTGELVWDAFMGGAAYAVLGVADFTGDGVPDVIGGGQTAGNQGRVIAINGANGNIVWDYITSGTAVWALEQLDDITGNGIPDVIAGSFNGFYYLMNSTNGNVEHSGSLGNSLIIDFWQAGDLNNDGFKDIFPSYSTIPNAVAISGQDGQLLWTTPVQDQAWSVAPMRDITGNGINDVAVGTLFNNNFVNFIQGSDGQILESVAMPGAVDAIAAIPDITGNYAMEVVASSRTGYVAALSGGTLVSPDMAAVSFLVTDSGDPANPVEGALIQIQGPASLNLLTDASGQASAMLPAGEYTYTVSALCFQTTDHEFVMQDENVDINVVLSGTPGDANGDEVVNILDVITIVNYFTDQEVETFCFANADVNQDGNIDVLDIISTVAIFINDRVIRFAF
ncbi:MAG: choice-of-anchor D domain-containing protein [Bacteroidales bacterium]|nr:choice-of-anchor D domain-containing protein [Bacteroidales bacterium]